MSPMFMFNVFQCFEKSRHSLAIFFAFTKIVKITTLFHQVNTRKNNILGAIKYFSLSAFFWL